MHRLVDIGSLAAFTFFQWLICREVLASSWARASRERLRLLRLGLAVFYSLIAAGVVLSFAHSFLRVHGHARLATLIGGAVFLWLSGSSAGYALYWVFHRVSGLLPGLPFDPARRQLFNAAGGALAASPFLVAGYGAFVQRTDFRVREVDVAIPNLPAGLEGLRLVQISDIHLSAFLSERELARVIDAANQVRAHLAVVTGDLISSAGDPLDACLRQLARVRADAGVFGCMGNHEYSARAESYTRRHGARLGIRFLRYERQTLRFGRDVLNLAGVDYQSSSHRPHYLRGAERLVVPGALNVLLSHNPDVLPVAARQGYDLMLSGHTHGGQVTVEILDQSINPARFYTPFVYGLYAEGETRAYVTRGIGTIGIPVRIGAPPEIAVMRLRKA